jgi:hypothetical protein
MIRDFLAAGEAQHDAMRASALGTIRQRYSFENNIIETLCRTIPVECPPE